MAESFFKGKKKRRKKKKNNYFTNKTQEAIVKFQNESNDTIKKQIYVENIQPSLVKLVENLIFVYKFHTIGNIDILKNDCVSFLFESLNKYDVTRGHKAFSYFNVIAKNWFIQKGKVYKKKNKSDVQFDNVILSKLEKNNNETVVISYEDEIMKLEYLKLLKKEIKSWRNKFEKEQEKKVLEAIILLLENTDLIDIYNKKGIYFMLREICHCNTKQIVTNLAKFKKRYDIFKKKYHNGEI